MLFERFPIRYRRPDRTPIQLFLSGNQLLISCNLRFSEAALKRKPTGCSQTYAELVAEGIQRFWSGDYILPLEDEPLMITVDVLVTTGPHRRAVPVFLRRMLFMPAHVRSPWYRHFWGLLRTGQLESIGTNWSLEHPGAMILPFMQDPEQIQRIAAHEAGHLFGLGDAYGAIYRFYDAAPDTGAYMMHANWAVQPSEILMLLRAHQTNRMQFFPRRFSWARFREGFVADIKFRLAEAEARIAQQSSERSRRRTRRAPSARPDELPTISPPEAPPEGQPEALLETPSEAPMDATSKTHADPPVAALEEAVVERIHNVDNGVNEPTAAPPSEPIAQDRIPDRPDQQETPAHPQPSERDGRT